MLLWIVFGLFCVAALFSLLLGVFNAIKFCKMTNVQVTETSGKSLPTRFNSYNRPLRDVIDSDIDGVGHQERFGINKTRGKEINFHLSLSSSEIREGYKVGNPLVMVKTRLVLGFLFLVVFGFCAIGTGLLIAELYFGLAFIGIAVLFGYVFIKQLYFGKNPEPEGE